MCVGKTIAFALIIKVLISISWLFYMYWFYLNLIFDSKFNLQSLYRSYILALKEMENFEFELIEDFCFYCEAQLNTLITEARICRGVCDIAIFIIHRDKLRFFSFSK